MEMGLAENTKIAHDLISALDQGRLDLLENLLHEDLEWWVLGTTKGSGFKNKKKLIREFQYELSLGDGPFRFELGPVTAEADRVLAEVTSHLKLKTGGIYANTYVFKLQIKDGKIYKVREFLDTALVDRMFGPVEEKKVS